MNCKSVSVMREPPSFLLQSKLISLAVSFSIYSFYDFDATRFQINFGYFWFLLKSYHIILILIAPIGLEKTFNGLKIKFSNKIIWFKWLRQFLLALFDWSSGFCLYVMLFSWSIVLSWCLIDYLCIKNILVLPLRHVWAYLLTSLESLDFHFLKIFFWTLSVLKLILMKYDSVSKKSGASYFPLEPILIWLAVPSSNYCFYELEATKFQKKN